MSRKESIENGYEHSTENNHASRRSKIIPFVGQTPQSLKATGAVPKPQSVEQLLQMQQEHMLQQQQQQQDERLNINYQQHQHPAELERFNELNAEIAGPLRRDIVDFNDFYLLATVASQSSKASASRIPKSFNSNDNLTGKQCQQDTARSQLSIQGATVPPLGLCREESQNHWRKRYTQSVPPHREITENFNAAIGIVLPATSIRGATNAHVLSLPPAISHADNFENSDNPRQTFKNLKYTLQRCDKEFENPVLPLQLENNFTEARIISSAAANEIRHNESIIQQFKQALAQQQSSGSAYNTDTDTDHTKLLQTPEIVLLNLFKQYSLLADKLSKHSKLTNHDKNSASRMVNDTNPNGSETGVVVNSASLESVSLSDVSDNIAQSIQSLHSDINTPTPDTTPSYQDLQKRLETSNQRIHNLEQQQNQLTRVKIAAKKHLEDMEKTRGLADNLSFNAKRQPNQDNEVISNGVGDQPNYQSVDEVTSDMSTLVGRIQNLSTFINNQLELSKLLGDDGSAENLSEQLELERRLESLRTQRDEMRVLVEQLQNFNQEVDKKKCLENQAKNEVEEALENSDKEATPTARQVPVEYVRDVPIEMSKETADNFNGCQTEIDEMNSQLRVLKNMMAAINVIEARTNEVQKQCSRDATPQNLPHYDRESTPTAANLHFSNAGKNQPLHSNAYRTRALNDVASCLKSYAEHVQTEKDAIKTLNDEIGRRKEQAAVAARLGEDALKRQTPTLLTNSRADTQNQSDLVTDQHVLESLLNGKQNQLQMLYKALQNKSFSNDDSSTAANKVRTTSRDEQTSELEDDDDVTTADLNSDYAASTGTTKYYGNVETTRAGAAINSQQSDVKQSRINTANTFNSAEQSAAATSAAAAGGSNNFDATSVQSGSTHSFAMPPPMPNVGQTTWPGTNPAAWNCFGGDMANNNSEYIFNPINTNVTASNVMGRTTTSSNVSATLQPDSMWFQQFIQTQQMLINYVSQCNQMLWQQQRSIENLNSNVQMLQESLLKMGALAAADMAFNLRSESVPTNSRIRATPVMSGVQNGLGRAHSEQPIQPVFTQPMAFSNNLDSSSQQHQEVQHNIYQFRQHGLASTTAGNYNYSTEAQQQQKSTAASSTLYSTLNNAAATQANVIQPTQFNNEMPQSPIVGAGPGPIFMHHHNNSIHQNNANLRTQNQYANNLPHSNIVGNPLNNQVPPGNRANNYWDNFRSYSRQNLLSTVPTKSNEDQRNQQQQQPQRSPATEPAVGNVHDDEFIVQNSMQSDYCTKQHVTRRNQRPRRFLQQQKHEISTSSASSNSNTMVARNEQQLEGYDTLSIRDGAVDYPDNVGDGLYNDILQHSSESNVPYATSYLRDISRNINLGNSPSYMRNKVPSKATCRTATANETITCLQERGTAQLNSDDLLSSLGDRVEKTSSKTKLAFESSNISNNDRTGKKYLAATLHVNNENSVDEVIEADDEADNVAKSEEIKRNLLINAFKNEKFTRQFVKAIKDDDLRQLQTFLDKVNTVNEIETTTSATTAVESNQNQILEETNSLNVNDQLSYVEENNLKTMAKVECELPRNSTVQSAIHREVDSDAEVLRNPYWQQRLINHLNILDAKKMKNQPKFYMDLEEDEDALEGACSLAAQEANRDKKNTQTYQQNDDQPLQPTVADDSLENQQFSKTEIVEQIIAAVRNKSNSETVVDRMLIDEVSKISSNIIRNSSVIKLNSSFVASTVCEKVSSSMIFKNLQKFSIPWVRDEFLTWYKNYLEEILEDDQCIATNNSVQETLQHKIPTIDVSPAVNLRIQNDICLREDYNFLELKPTKEADTYTLVHVTATNNRSAANADSTGNLLITEDKSDQEQSEQQQEINAPKKKKKTSANEAKKTNNRCDATSTESLTLSGSIVPVNSTNLISTENSSALEANNISLKTKSKSKTEKANGKKQPVTQNANKNKNNGGTEKTRRGRKR